jgi:hypothetical protein
LLLKKFKRHVTNVKLKKPLNPFDILLIKSFNQSKIK